MLRLLSAIRLSVLTDATTSPDRQRDANRENASALGANIIGEALDLDVSASKTSPFERPSLGEWLKTPDRYDGISWWRQDRAIRNMDHMHALSTWAKEHRKLLVFREGPGGARLTLDFRNPLDPVTQLMVTVFAFAAQMEAQAIQDRVTGAQAALRSMPLRWRGGRPPYGYRSKELSAGGHTLVPDPGAVEVLERMMGLVAEGKSWVATALELQRAGIPTPVNRLRELAGKEPTDSVWNARTVAHILSSPALLGHKTYQGSTVRDAEGAPVPFTKEPILTRDEWDQLQSVVATKSADTAPRRDTVNALLTGVAHCDSCGGRMYWTARKAPRVSPYKCGHRQRGQECTEPAGVRGDWLDEWTEAEFLRRFGALQVVETRRVPGSDPRPEIAEVTAELEAHYARQGTQRSSAARAAWQKHADALDARLAALEEIPVVLEHTERVAGSRTYREAWEAADTADRRRMLLDAGVRVYVRRAAPGGYRALDDSRVSMEVTDEWFADAELELEAVAADAV